VAATRGQAQIPWLQADFSASLSLHARSRGALLHGSRSPCLALLPVTLCRTLRAMLVCDPPDRICSFRLPHSPPALDSGCSWSPPTTWRLRVRWHLEITMRQVSALESTWEQRGRDPRPGPESVASGRLFCLSLAPRALPQRAAARILASVPCFVACDALPHSPRFVGR
jgi:hypothetical protein